MPVRIGALAKNLPVLLLAPFFAVHTVSRVKMLFACYIDHHNISGANIKTKNRGLFYIRCQNKAIMRILVVAATSFEVESLKSKVLSQNQETRIKNQEIEFLVTGVGMVATAFALGKHLAVNSHDLVLNLGIAGSFNRDIAIGEVVEIVEDHFSELGADDDEEFLTIDEMD